MIEKNNNEKRRVGGENEMDEERARIEEKERGVREFSVPNLLYFFFKWVKKLPIS